MAQQNDTSVLNFIAGEALEADRRVKLSGAVLRTVIYADAGEPCIGITQRGVLISADVPVKMIASGAGSFKIETAGVTTVNAKLYGAADGKVSETVSGAAEWFGRAAASGSGSIIECIPTSAAVIGGGAAALDWQESVAARLTVPAGGEAVGYRALVITAATGAFVGEEDSIAILEEDGSWTFIAPTEGFAAAVEDEDLKYFYNGTAWVGNAHITDAAAATAITITDNSSGADPGDDIVAIITEAATMTDSSGGTDPGDDTIAVVTNAANAGSADVAPVTAAIAQIAAKVNVNSLAVDSSADAIAQLIAKVNAQTADVALIRTALNAALAQLAAIGLQAPA